MNGATPVSKRVSAPRGGARATMSASFASGRTSHRRPRRGRARWPMPGMPMPSFIAPRPVLPRVTPRADGQRTVRTSDSSSEPKECGTPGPNSTKSPSRASVTSRSGNTSTKQPRISTFTRADRAGRRPLRSRVAARVGEPLDLDVVAAQCALLARHEVAEKPAARVSRRLDRVPEHHAPTSGSAIGRDASSVRGRSTGKSSPPSRLSPFRFRVTLPNTGPGELPLHRWSPKVVGCSITTLRTGI